MSPRQVGVILKKDLYQGPKNFLFIWAIVAPLVIFLIVSFALGGFISDPPKLGIYLEGDSKLAEMTDQMGNIQVRLYSTADALRRSVDRGSLDMGVILPVGIDRRLASEDKVVVNTLVWGSSPAKDRALLRTSLLDGFRKIIGDKPVMDVEFVTVGEGDFVPWKDRLLPFIVLMAVFLGGAFLPAGGLIDEKERDTLRALTASPATLGEIIVAKGIIGVIVSLFVGVAILLLNGAFGTQPLLLVVVLALGGIMASEFGIISGILLDDITSLFALWKAGGIFLFAPGFVYLFPRIPQWVGKIIPTYYYVAPVVKITQEGSGWPGISTSVFILIGINLALVGLLFAVVGRTERRLI